jgi:lactate dehydrogenase-like 2-hydroxyacid dehydrogenase
VAREKLLITRRLTPNVEARAARDYDAITNPDDRIWEADELVDRAAGCDAILCATSERFDDALFARLPESVKIVATYSVGYEHIDVDAAKRHGVAISNTPDVLTDATADAALLCLLGAARRGSEADKFLRAGQWEAWHALLLLGRHVSGKRLGILGMGRIGRAVAKRARGFDMVIHYHNRTRLPADLEQGAHYHVDPEDLLQHCDFLSINAPSSASTRGFLNAERLAMMPAGAIVVNTARGDLVDDDALIAALESGHIAAAGLDVFAGEPNVDERYFALPNTFLLPHVGSATYETRDAMGYCCLDNIDAYFRTGQCPNAL